MDQDVTWYGARPQPRRLCVRWGPRPFLQKGAEPPPEFSAHFYCGQTTRCTKMPLGMDVGLIPGDIVLDGDPVLPPQQRGQSLLPIFGPFLLCPNGWMHRDATWQSKLLRHGVRHYSEKHLLSRRYSHKNTSIKINHISKRSVKTKNHKHDNLSEFRHGTRGKHTSTKSRLKVAIKSS